MHRPDGILDIFKIEHRAYVKLNSDMVIKPHKIRRAGFDTEKPLYAIIFAVPYLTEIKNKNLSAYAVPRDYHLYFKELFASLIPALEKSHPSYSFAGFADDSPIDERRAALVGGLGILGNNSLIITEEYSSYIFLGEIITDMPLDTEEHEIKGCEGCGRCQKECPQNECGVCLSALTQKKGELNEDEKKLIKKYGSVWGCDICQEVCPHTIKAQKAGTIYTNIDFFKKSDIPTLSISKIDAMSDKEFSERAYSWRGRDTIRRNLLILEEDSDT